MNTPVLETVRLILRPFRQEDAQDVFVNWESDPEVAKYMFWTSHHDIKKTKQWLGFEIGRIDKQDWYRFAIEEKSTHNFEPAVAQFKLMFPGNHTIITVPESPMFNVPEAEVVTAPRLELVKAAGKQYAECGEINSELLAEICSPMIPEEVYANIVNGNL